MIHQEAIATLRALSAEEVQSAASYWVRSKKGAYVLGIIAPEEADILLIATGSEVHLITQSAGFLAKEGIKSCTISIPSVDLFEKQSTE